MPRLSLPLLCFGIILVQLDEGRFITKARPKKYDCSEIEKYSRENALQTSGKSVEGEVANWWKGQMPLCSRTQWSFESLADQNSEFLCWRFQFCAQLTPSNEKYWQKGTRKFYSQAIWPSFSRPSTQEGRGTWLVCVQLLQMLAYNWGGGTSVACICIFHLYIFVYLTSLSHHSHEIGKMWCGSQKRNAGDAYL